MNKSILNSFTSEMTKTAEAPWSTERAVATGAALGGAGAMMTQGMAAGMQHGISQPRFLRMLAGAGLGGALATGLATYLPIRMMSNQKEDEQTLNISVKTQG